MDSNLTLHNDPKIWVEKTNVKGVDHRLNEHFGLGKALWSPRKSSGGSDIYRRMREVNVGDIVLHLVDGERISGVSKVSSKCIETERYVGSPWDGEIYNVDLIGYIELKKPISRSELLSKDNKPILVDILDKKEKTKQVFYNKDLKLREGAYLTDGDPKLVNLLNEIYYKNTEEYLPYIGETMGFGENSNEIKDNIDNEYSLNTILYGPPGTGKTYNVIKEAITIITGKEPKDNEIKDKYKELKEKGQIEFITFHQSYSYEDFIEGYKPDDNDGELFYTVKDGILKNISKKAEKNYNLSKNIKIRSEFNAAFNELFGNTDFENGGILEIPMKTSSFKIYDINETTIYYENVAGKKDIMY